MKPEYQTKWGKGVGNCFQYALASILELDPEAVPDFCNEYDDDWHEEAVKWLNQFGLSMMTVTPHNKKLDDYWFNGCTVMVCVENDEHVKHAVLYRDGKILHDPNFWYNGEYSVCEVDLIFPMNPAEAINKSNCLTCKYWGPKETENRDIQETLPCLCPQVGATSSNTDKTEGLLLFGSCYYVNKRSITIVTKPDFGCVLYERKEP